MPPTTTTNAPSHKCALQKHPPKAPEKKTPYLFIYVYVFNMFVV